MLDQIKKEIGEKKVEKLFESHEKNVERQEKYKDSGTYKGAGFNATSTSFFQTIAAAEKRANAQPATYVQKKGDRFGYIKDKCNFVKEGKEYRHAMKTMRD